MVTYLSLCPLLLLLFPTFFSKVSSLVLGFNFATFLALSSLSHFDLPPCSVLNTRTSGRQASGGLTASGIGRDGAALTATETQNSCCHQDDTTMGQ